MRHKMLDNRIDESHIIESGWSLGRSDAHVTILEYGDFECPYSAMLRPLLEGLVDDYPDAIQLIFRHFPVTRKHKFAVLAAEAAEAAGVQGMFWEMHDMLFTHQDQLKFENLHYYARFIGLNVEHFKQDIETHHYRKKVQGDFRRGIRDGVHDTPTIFINGHPFYGHRDRASIISAVAAQMPA